MGTSITPAFVAFMLSATFGAFEILAQTGGDPSTDTRRVRQNAEASYAEPMQPDTKPGNGRAVVSVDLLRHPITPKVRQLLLKAMEKMDSGEHETAIAQLLVTLGKYPDSAPYVHNLLGVEYVKTDQFQAAVRSFEQAVRLLPRDAMTHYNFGLALICAGDYDRAEQQVRQALELDPTNPRMQARLRALAEHRRSGN